MSTTLRHARPRPSLAAKVTPVVAAHHKLVAGGTILTLPAMATSLVAASPASATPGAPTAPTTAPTANPTAPAPGGSSTAVVYLRYGSTGDYVKVAQQRLGGLSADGIFGPLTLSATKSFQSSHGLVADGIIGPLTWNALGGFPATGTGTPTTPPPSTTPPPPAQPVPTCTVTTVSYGATGAVVATLQQRLGGLTADGVFGPLTLAAVKSYQGSHNLVANGVVDNATWNALGGYPCTTTTDPGTGGTGGTTDPGTGGTTGTTSYDAKIAQVVDTAKQYLGIPYVWGGSSPSQGFDCSGLTAYVYNQLGMPIPRTASQQQRAVTPTNNPVPGDLVFFGYPAYHVAIYLSPGLMLESPHPGDVVKIEKMWTTPTGYAHYTG